MPPFYTYISAGTPPFLFGNALQFDGVNDYISFTQINTGVLFSFNCWIKIIDFQQYGYITGNGTNTGIAVRESTIAVEGFTPGEIYIYDGSTVVHTLAILPFNTWQMLTVTKNGTNYKVYLNGVLMSQHNIINTINYNSIGRFNGTTNYFGGYLDELLYYNNIELTATQITDLWNNGNYRNPLLIQSNPSAYYKMNETTGDSIAIDSSGNGNNGTLNNFDTSTCWVAH